MSYLIMALVLWRRLRKRDNRQEAISQLKEALQGYPSVPSGRRTIEWTKLGKALGVFDPL